MKRFWHPLALSGALFAVLALTATEAQAQGMVVQPAYQSRIFVGVGLGYNYIFNDSERLTYADESDSRITLTSSGFDWTLYLGLRFNPWVSAEVAWDAFYHPSGEGGTYNYAMIDGVSAALRIFFPTGLNIMPFLRLSGGFYMYGDEFQVDDIGFGYSAGLGVNYQFLNQILEMDVLVNYRAWYFDGIGEASRCGGGYCPFGDEYIHSVNLVLAFNWNSWAWAW